MPIVVAEMCLKLVVAIFSSSQGELSVCICDLVWPLGVYWSCFDVRCQAILDLEGALEITNSTCIPRVLALCHPLGMEMIPNHLHGPCLEGGVQASGD